MNPKSAWHNIIKSELRRRKLFNTHQIEKLNTICYNVERSPMKDRLHTFLKEDLEYLQSIDTEALFQKKQRMHQ